MQVDESISNETWLIKIADKKTCANLQNSFDSTVMLPLSAMVTTGRG